MTVTEDDVRIKRLVFESLSRGTHGLSTGVGDFLLDGKVSEMMKGASALELEVLDREYAGLGSGLFGTRVIATIDASDYRLTTVSCVGTERLRGLFEHRLISAMREHTRPLKATRGSVTRAEFILSMLRELKLPYIFVCPELHRKQPTAAPEVTEEKAEEPTAQGEPAEGEEPAPESPNVGEPRTLSGSGLTVKHAPVNTAQLHVLNTALNTALGLSAPELAEVALVVALIQENSCTNPDPGDPGDRGCLSLIDSTIHGIQKRTGTGTINPYDIDEVTAHFLTAGYFGKGGAIELARKNPSWSAGQIAQACQGSAYPNAYAQWDGEAKAIVRAFNKSETMSGGGSTTASQQTTTKTATYEFSRGQPEQREDTFTCAQRLAEEVGWHFFVSGPRTIYFVNDDDLLKVGPRVTITPDSPGLVGPPLFDVEVGGRTVIVKGKRVPKPSECEMKARVNRWQLPPGTVVTLEGWGPADGKWIVSQRERGLFDAEGTIHLVAPAKPLEEPAATSSTAEQVTGGLGSSGVPKGDPNRLAQQHPEIKQHIREVVASILAKYPDLVITSTTSGGHASASYHFRGEAVDIAGPSMAAAAQWINTALYKELAEGIHNPGLSVKDGKHVDPSFWGAVTWAGHADHIHVAAA